jgi:hypothetical protein
MFIINAGPGFRMLWNKVVKGFLDPRTSSKIQVVGNKYQSKLLEIIDASELPEFLGGSCNCEDQGGCLRSEKGPWKDPNILKIVVSGKTQFSKLIEPISSSEGGAASESTKIKGKEVCAADSISDSEDIASPKSPLDYSDAKLTPVRQNGYSHSVSVDVPMIDIAVDSRCKEQPSVQHSHLSKETRVQKTTESAIGKVYSCILAQIVTFCMIILAYIQSVAKKLTVSESGSAQRTSESATVLDQQVLLLTRKLGELETKVEILQARTFRMSDEKEELLNAAICRVDALEAELISTKKSLHEALMRQEELLAYIDSQEEAKFRKKKFC